MSLFRLWIGVLAVSAFAADSELDTLLKGVENRYNKAKTLQVVFHETYIPAGKPQRLESGMLMLRKPGKMRWDYTQPKGKLFISDGKSLWLYTPADNRAEKMKLQESEDMRAPLAFLLGKLNFKKEFQNVQARAEGNATRIVAQPKSDSLPYTEVEFVVMADRSIREVKVKGFDRSTLVFVFGDEKMNPPLNSNLFQFKPPAGVQVIDEAGQ